MSRSAIASPVLRNGVQIGAVTCVLRRRGSDGTRLYLGTAGHLARIEGARYEVGGLGEVRVVERSSPPGVDMALLETPSPIPEHALRLPNGVQLRGARAHASLSVGWKVGVFRRGGTVPVPTEVSTFRSKVTFQNAEGQRVEHGPMIGVANVTDPGDSGALLIDEHNYAVGMLVGEGPADIGGQRRRVGWYLAMEFLLNEMNVQLEW